MTFQLFPIMVYNQFLSSLLAQGIIPRFTKENKIISRLEHEMNRRSRHYTPFREFIPIDRISEPLQTGLTPEAAGG